MVSINTMENHIEEIIDDLKGLCQTNGLSNQASEEEIITSVFLYKFLNDKFMYCVEKFSQEVDMTIKEILEDNKDNIQEVLYMTYSKEVVFRYDETIEYLVKKVADNEFYKIFDNALEGISNNPRNESFGIETADGNREPLFKRLTETVEMSGRNNFAQSLIGIISQSKFDFGEAFDGNFDFYSRIFEYLIKDYNVASGTYAEYFTPQAISKLIAKILVQMSPVEATLYDIYDPSAGSGSLILHLAHELGESSFGNKAQVYTQDISAKSSRFLRINMLLNGLVDSLDNIIKGDTLVSPAHYNITHDINSGIKTFDFITSNPPFKMDFSSTRDIINQKWVDSLEQDGIKRFFAGVPKILKKNKDKMSIYLCFIQHILWSLNENGKAAIVVPTGFITAQSGIEKKIRQKIIDNKWLKGVISMPSNLFANTGTNVSVLFIDKSNLDDDVLLIDASNLGEKIKEGRNQKTILSDEEIALIENTFIGRQIIDDFSVLASYAEIRDLNYSFSAGQYFDVKIEFVEISKEEFDNKLEISLNKLDDLFLKSEKLNDKIKSNLEELFYD